MVKIWASVFALDNVLIVFQATRHEIIVILNIQIRKLRD